MKHLKHFGCLNESLSRYDFGKYHTTDALSDFRKHIDFVAFTYDENKEIINAVPRGYKIDNIDLSIRVRNNGKIVFFAYSLGDYCYAIVEWFDHGLKDLYIIDDFDNFLITIKNVVS